MEGPIYNAAYLSKHLIGYETLVVGGSPLPSESHSGSVFSNLGIETLEIPQMGRSISPWNDWITNKQIKNLISKFKPDIIHSHCFGFDGIPARIAASQDRSAILVHTFHGHVFSQSENLKNQLLKTIEKRLSKKWNAIIAISSSQKAELVNTYKICSSEKTHIIPLGVDLGRFEKKAAQFRNSIRDKYNIQEDEIVIGIVARLSPVKNHQLFIDAIDEVKKANQKIRAIIIGDGELKNSLMDYAKQKDLYTNKSSTTIIFTSWIEKVEEILPALDLFVLTSHSEGTPLSIIEAQASGLPIISTNVGGVKDCLIDGETGILVAPSDIKSMSAALLQLCDDATLRIQIGTAGHQFVSQNFSYSRLVNDIEQLYTSLLKQRSSMPI